MSPRPGGPDRDARRSGPADLEQIRRRVRNTRLAAVVLLAVAVVLGSRLARVDYADWATRRDVVLSPDSPAAAAAELFQRARADWATRPGPETWLALREAVVPEERGTAAGDWPWGPPVLFLAGPENPDGRLTPVQVTGFRSSVGGLGQQKGDRVVECVVTVRYVVIVNPGTAEIRSREAADQVVVRFVEAEKRWLVKTVSPGPGD
ncbi:MAG: hypothetical protein AB1645_09035 [Bacillota bacterium]